MPRNCRYKPSPPSHLILALCQVRLSLIPQMDHYTPAIQEVFRRQGFPIERDGPVHEVTFRPSGGTPVEVMERQRWEFRNREETWRVLVTEDSVILQTTAYPRFEQFAEQLQFLLHVESRGQTVVGGDPGTMIVRVVQNDQGHSLPPDLMAVNTRPSLRCRSRGRPGSSRRRCRSTSPSLRGF